MGVNYNVAKYLKRCADKGCDYSRLAMLGHQEFYIAQKMRNKLEKEVALFKGSLDGKYSDRMFLKLGAKNVDVVDISDYEGANIIHDMNNPIPAELYGKYTCVFDGGATEHIFNFPVAIVNVMKMLDPGGVYIGMVPSDHLSGHGFYQFGPMVYIQLFCEQNGFELMELAFSSNPDSRELYVINEPTSHRRIEINSNRPMMIYVFAKKIKNIEGDVKLYEGYYQDMWEGGNGKRQVSRYTNIPDFLMRPARALKGALVRQLLHIRERNALKLLCKKVLM